MTDDRGVSALPSRARVLPVLTCTHCGQPPKPDRHGFRVLADRDGALWCQPCMDGALTPAMRAALEHQAALRVAAERDCATLRTRMDKPATVARLAVLTGLPQARVRAMIGRMDRQGYRITRIKQFRLGTYLYRLDKLAP